MSHESLSSNKKKILANTFSIYIFLFFHRALPRPRLAAIGDSQMSRTLPELRIAGIEERYQLIDGTVGGITAGRLYDIRHLIVRADVYLIWVGGNDLDWDGEGLP